MTDQLFLSVWLEKRYRDSRVHYFSEMLKLFPFSQREQPQSTLTILAVDSTEPPLLEKPINGPIDVEDVIEAFKDYQGDDVAYKLESWWDLWQFSDDWNLTPSRVALSCFGPHFDAGIDHGPNVYKHEGQEDMRIDFGVDSHYLPQPDAPGSLRMVQSNIRSLLRLVHEVDSTLPVLRRRLDTETGENFADRLQRLLIGSESIQ